MGAPLLASDIRPVPSKHGSRGGGRERGPRPATSLFGAGGDKTHRLVRHRLEGGSRRLGASPGTPRNGTFVERAPRRDIPCCGSGVRAGSHLPRAARRSMVAEGPGLRPLRRAILPRSWGHPMGDRQRLQGPGGRAALPVVRVPSSEAAIQCMSLVALMLSSLTARQAGTGRSDPCERTFSADLRSFGVSLGLTAERLAEEHVSCL